MLININRTRLLELIGNEIENSENREYHTLIKVQPIAREDRQDEIVQKVAVDNHLAYNIPKGIAEQFIATAIATH